MVIDATFWVAVSFVIFIGGLVYLKVPHKINEALNKMILDIKNEIGESEKLRNDSKVLLDKAQSKLESAKKETKEILDQAKKDSEELIITMNENQFSNYQNPNSTIFPKYITAITSEICLTTARS